VPCKSGSAPNRYIKDNLLVGLMYLSVFIYRSLKIIRKKQFLEGVLININLSKGVVVPEHQF